MEKAKLAEKARERWQDPAYRAKMESINKDAAKKRDTSGAKNGMFGRSHTEETRDKQSEIRKKMCQEDPLIMKKLGSAFKEKLNQLPTAKACGLAAQQ